jgi:hypothetical protein
MYMTKRKRRTGNTMTKRKRTGIQWPKVKAGQEIQWPKEKGQTMICNTLHRKLKVQQHRNPTKSATISPSIQWRGKYFRTGSDFSKYLNSTSKIKLTNSEK